MRTNHTGIILNQPLQDIFGFPVGYNDFNSFFRYFPCNPVFREHASASESRLGRLDINADVFIYINFPDDFRSGVTGRSGIYTVNIT